MKKYVLSLLFLFLSTLLGFSQPTKQVEMADTLRSSGKIYVVVAVIVVIFLGILFYMISIDRKISKLEKEHKKFV